MGNSAEKWDDQPVSISALAAEVMARNESIEDAARELRNLALSNRPVYDALTEPLLAQACYDAVRAVCRQERRAIWTAPGYTAAGNGERVQAHGRSLLDMPLPGGKLLRDATRTDLEAAAAFYRKQAKTMAEWANWLTAVASKVGRAKVGNKLTEDQLRALQQEARDE